MLVSFLVYTEVNQLYVCVCIYIYICIYIYVCIYIHKIHLVFFRFSVQTYLGFSGDPLGCVSRRPTFTSVTGRHLSLLSMVFSWVLQPHIKTPEYWSGFPRPSPGDLSYPGVEPMFPTVQVDSLLSEPRGKPKNTGVGSLFLLQWIFLTQKSNLDLLLCRWILYQLSYQGST